MNSEIFGSIQKPEDGPPIPPPVITSIESLQDYLDAVQRATGIVQLEARARSPTGVSNRTVARLWPIYFTREQQEAILVEFAIRRLAR